MKNNKILNIVIIAILSNISVNATSQQQSNKDEDISSTLQCKNTTNELNNTTQKFDEDSSNSSNSDISDSEKIKLHKGNYNKPYEVIGFDSKVNGVLIKNKTKINAMYPSLNKKNCNGLFTTVDNFDQEYLNKEYKNIQKTNTTQKEIKIKDYTNNNKYNKKHLADEEQCDNIMYNGEETNNYNINKYNELIQKLNQIALDFNELYLVQNNDKMKIKQLNNKLIKQRKNNCVTQKKINELNTFIKETNKKIETVKKTYKQLKENNNKHIINKKRYREDTKYQNNKNNISINNKNNVNNKNNNKDNSSISFSCLSPSSLSLYDSSSSED